jgi:hypothetical protein
MSRSNSADSIPYSWIGPNRVHMPAGISKLDSGSTHQDRGGIHVNCFPSRSPSRLIQKQGAWDRAVSEFEAKFVYYCTTSRGTFTSYFSQQALTRTGSVKTEHRTLVDCVQQQIQFTVYCYMCTRAYQQATKAFQDLRLAHTGDVREYGYIAAVRISSASTTSYRLYLNLVVRRDYSSPGRTGSTSTSPCAASTRLPAAATLHRLRRTPPRHRILGVRLPRLLTSTSLNQKTSRGRLPRHQQLVGSTSD